MSRTTQQSLIVATLVALTAVTACQPARPAAKKDTPPPVPGIGAVTTIRSTRLQTGGVELQTGGAWRPLEVGGQVPADAALRTVPGVQARLSLFSGVVLNLNEGTHLVLKPGRKLALKAGEVLAEVAPGGKSPVELETATGTVRITGTKLNVKVEAEATTVDVTRGTVEVAGKGGGRVEVGAGERAVVKGGGAPRVSVSGDLAEVTRWTRELGPIPGQAQSLQPGIGSLEARVPGQGRSLALRLASQEVRVTVQDNVARTEVEQSYYNASAQTLEGTYRFPLPAGATISRLALYVGNRLEEGEIVERQRARQIFRQIVEDTIRPRDPALLEWVGGRTFQMKIFPIPPRGARRVILAYTQPLAASHGRYRYEYPLASDPGKATTVGRFAIDMRVASSRGVGKVTTPLYPTTIETENPSGAAQAGQSREAAASKTATRLRYAANDFRPAASFVANIVPASEPPELQLALFEPARAERDGRCASEAAGAATGTGAALVDTVRRMPRPERTDRRRPACGDRGGFFMATLRPELPSEGRARPRDYLFLLDSSYSTGKRGWGVQLAALEAFLTEMDLRSRFLVLACDVRCKPHATDFQKATAEARQNALRFARGVTPGGSSNLQGAFEEAAGQIARKEAAEPRRAGSGATDDSARAASAAQVIYMGDGRPSAGELREPELARLVVGKLSRVGAGLTALQIGDDASELFLTEATRRLGGAVHRLGAGDDVASLVFDVVAALYRPTLSDLELSFEGLDVHHVYPQKLGALTAGAEVVLVGRYGKGGQGALKLHGKLGGKPFERRYPLHLAADSVEKQANQFIPRVWAEAHIEDLTLEGYAANRAEIVRVSKAYTVLSRATAFLVLENERMYREFGVTRRKHDTRGLSPLALRQSKDQPEDKAKAANQPAATATPTGASAAPGLASAVGKAGGGSAGPMRAAEREKTPASAAEEAPPPAAKHASPKADAAEDLDSAAGADPAPRDEARQPDTKEKMAKGKAEPAAEAKRRSRSAPAKKMPAARPRPLSVDDLRGDRVGSGYGGGRARMAPITTARIDLADGAPGPAAVRAEEMLRRQLEASPLRRALHVSYQRVLLQNGRAEEALRHAEKWAEVDGESAAPLTALADAQAIRSDLATAMRMRASAVDVEPGSQRLHRELAELYRNKGELRLSCAHLWSLVSLAPRAQERYVALARCLAGTPEGKEPVVQLLSELAGSARGREVGSLGRTLAAVRAAVAAPAIPAAGGALSVRATWDQPLDLDLVLVTPRGERLSAMGAPAGVVEADSHDGRTPEVLRLRSLRDGNYRIEVARPQGAKGAVSGTVMIQALGKTRTVAFAIPEASDGLRTLARVSVTRTYPMRYYR